ncbi:MAG TPA: zf-HC2 domain-containing protein [Candidatus Binatia bacterium]|nr:zf-HC2 domain-containing protein [Candidatus Binatia bacterium]
MSCDHYESLIGDLVDGTLDGAPRHQLEAHLAACAACARLVEELLVVRRAARALPAIDLPSTAWARLSAAIEVESAAPRTPGRWRRFVLPLAAAAMLTAAIAGSLTWRRQVQQAGATQPVDHATASSAELQGSVEAEVQQAEKHLERAVASLEVLAHDRQALDPQDAAELQKNLLVVDQAIGESRAALKTQPMSTQAQDSLFEAFRSKIVLLQDTIALINEVRKGNQAETARIADAMNKQ